MRRQKEKKKLSIGQIIGLLVLLFALETDILAGIIVAAIFLVPIGLAGYLIYRVAKKSKGAATPRQTRQEAFDDCPKPLFCFHRDKGEHHVRRGKEIDPWDRPDIDISKYQRRQ